MAKRSLTNKLQKHKREVHTARFAVTGMHCKSCELLIERTISADPNVISVNASNKDQCVDVRYVGTKPSAEALSNNFKKDGYSFNDYGEDSENVSARKNVIRISKKSLQNSLIGLILGLAGIGVFLYLNKTGLLSLTQVGETSTLPTFFVFGLLAGISSCAALVGGLLLSFTKQWADEGQFNTSSQNILRGKWGPSISFNAGRLVSFALFGLILGAIGSVLQFSLTVGAIVTIAVSVLMIILGLQMLGFNWAYSLQPRLPKSLSRIIIGNQDTTLRRGPFAVGFLTFFLPCGFTITAQSLAVASGDPIRGMGILLAFALGTLIPLMAIGVLSAEFSSRTRLSGIFMKFAGILVLFFAVYSINAQLKVLDIPIGLPNPSRIGASSPDSPEGVAEVRDGKQVIEMDAYSWGYEPSTFTVQAGIPVNWVINDKGTSGCTNAVIARSLFEGQIPLTPGKTSTKEFTPQTPGTYRFSCWMGMVSGTIEVVETL